VITNTTPEKLLEEHLYGYVQDVIDKLVYPTKSILFIENRTNYRHHILKGFEDDTLVVYHGGFYSPTKRILFCLLSESLAPGADSFFWGDIDLGGFLMFSRLKKEIFPDLVPWRMGCEDFEKYKEHGVVRQQ